jgi:hypothetical protein
LEKFFIAVAAAQEAKARTDHRVQWHCICISSLGKVTKNKFFELLFLLYKEQRQVQLIGIGVIGKVTRNKSFKLLLLLPKERRQVQLIDIYGTVLAMTLWPR